MFNRALAAIVTFCWIGCQPAAPVSTGSGGAPSAGAAAGQPTRPADLTPREVNDWHACLNRFPSPCAEPAVTLAQCLEQPAGCHACPAASRFVADSIRAGHVSAQVEARYTARFDPAQVKTIDIAGAPSKGPANAAVTIVEFADFECPYCASVVPILDGLVESYAPHVRVVFLDFPIQYHKHAQLASQSAAAAHNQGKFWELHHLMFANRTQLENQDIERFARSLNLDMNRFRRDRDAEQTVQRIKSNYDQGVRVNVHGTPSFFLNGRAFDFDLFDFGGEDLLDWIELEIEMVTGKRPRRAVSRDGASAPVVAGAPERRTDR